jgi:hypothetical protein
MGWGHITIAAIIAIIVIIVTAINILPRSLLGLLGAIYIVLGLAQTFLFMGSGKENLRSGALLFIIAICIFFVLFGIFPMFP